MLNKRFIEQYDQLLLDRRQIFIGIILHTSCAHNFFNKVHISTKYYYLIEMNNNDTKKKRRVDSGIPAAAAGDGGIQDELSTIKSIMLELLNQNRTQTTSIQTMQRDITRLSNKCDRIESTMNTKLDGIEDKQNEDKLAANEYSHIENHKLNTLLLSMKGEITELTETCESVKLSSTNMKSQLDSIQIKQKCHEVLLKNQHWEYSALDYWDGDEDVEEEAEDLICKIRNKTKEMRYDNGVGDISINRRMVYHNELLPHWKEFASALEQYQYHLSKETEATLHLNGMELPDEVIDLLSTALK